MGEDMGGKSGMWGKGGITYGECLFPAQQPRHR